MAVADADPLIERLPVHWESWINVVLGVIFFPVGAVVAYRGFHAHTWVSLVIGLAICLLAIPLLAMSGLEVLRRPSLRDRTLVLPRGVHRPRRVDLAEISGVGLIYEASGQRASWSLRIWLADGNTFGVDSVRTFVRGRRGPEQPPPPPGIPRRHRPRLDWATLAATPAGRATLRIDRQVRWVQGPHGPLARLRDQCFAPSYGIYLAFFSPDGEIGWLTDGTRPSSDEELLGDSEAG